jgi:hypothetical protein
MTTKVVPGPHMAQAVMFFEKEELIMLLWALEMHCQKLADGWGEEGDHDSAYQLHQRIQAAWLEMREMIKK